MKNWETPNSNNLQAILYENCSGALKFVLSLMFFVLFLSISSAQSIDGCTGLVTDSGGAGADYSNNESITTTYCSDMGNQIKLTFTSFDIEENFDFLFIYDGVDTDAPIIGVFTNSNSPGAVVSTNGCLTLVFESDGSTTGPGYSADITCVDDCDVTIDDIVFTAASCMNTDGAIEIIASGIQGTIEYSFNSGMTYGSASLATGLVPGTYIVSARYDDGTCETPGVAVVINSGCVEICGNGIDDDGDMLVDSMDPDCENTIVGCSGIFTDDNNGLIPGNYSPNLDTIYTFCSDNGGKMEMTFTSFNLNIGVLADSLLVYDGPDENAPLIGVFFGPEGGIGLDQFRVRSFFQATGSCLTFRFKSGPFGEVSGWEAFYSCTDPAVDFGTEICGNGIDDDGDGMIDFQDPDCPEALDQVACQQGFEYFIPPIWKMAGDPALFSSPSILCLSTSFPEANVTLSTADGSYSRSITLTGGTTDTIRYDQALDILLTDVNNTVETNKGLIVTSDFPVQLLHVLDADLNKNLVTIKGKEAQGKSFRAGSQTRTLVQPPSGITREEHHFISVMATEDNTNVVIETTKIIQGQVSPINIILDRGETYLVINDDFNVTITGALITSDKNIVVTSGSQHTSAYGVTEDDGGSDQLVPTRSIGQDYILVRGGGFTIQDYAIVVATENNTLITVDGTPLATLNAGEFIEVDIDGVLGNGTYINGSEGIYVYHVSGLTDGEVGMAIAAPIGACRGDNSASFARADVGDPDPDELALNIVIDNAGLASLQLNGLPLNPMNYPTTTILPVASFPGFSTVTVRDADIAASNLVESDEYFNASVLIGNAPNSGTFGYITSFNERVNILDPILNESVEFYVIDTICADSSVDHTLTTASCGSTDKINGVEQGALGTVTVTGDLSFTYTSNGTAGEDVVSITVVNDFGIQSTVCIGIRIDTLFVQFDPNELLACSGEDLTLELDSIGGVGPYSYLWSTGEITPTIDVSPSMTTTYSVSVQDAVGCVGVDTVRVEIQPTVIANAGADLTACSGEVVQLMATQPVGTTGTWSGGAGIFSNTSSANSTYTPDISELNTTVMLIWSLSGGMGSMCFDGMDTLDLTVTPGLDVDAGDDSFICAGSDFDLAELNSQVNTTGTFVGFYSSDGDGVFMPGSTVVGDFGVATTYVPGPEDIANGSVVLTLNIAGDPMDPCSNGSDDVVLNIQSAPVLVCNDNLNISVNSDCLVELNVDMLIENPTVPEDFYTITLKDEFGNIIPGMTLNSAYINRTIEYSVEYLCGGNSCWGYITIEDKQIPDLVPGSRVVDCRISTEPTIASLPLPAGVTVFEGDNGIFFVEDFDQCSNVTLTYEDEVIDNGCGEMFETTIFRTYTATDESGNSTTAVDTVFVERITLADVIIPSNFDDIDEPSLSCSADFEKLDNGNPSPSVTGSPDAGLCQKFEATYTDLEFPMCGNTFKVVREWIIYDWCTSESIEIFQTIKITDKTAPTVDCPADRTISTDEHSCNSGLVLIETPEAMDNCSAVSIEVTVTGPAGEDILVSIQNGNFVVADLPLGTSIVEYDVTDECGNLNNFCNSEIFVFDNVPPTPICESHTKVSVNNVGTARLYAISLDDGSHDNCEIERFEVAKMTDACGFGALNFGDYVDFCCSEIGAPIMVALQVTDIYGNVNVCMVEVELEDKIAPIINAPANLTINCTVSFDEDDLSEFGTPTSFDNCDVIVTEEVQVDIDCGVGEIRRVFTATDPAGLKDSDVQIITVGNNDPFNINDIQFPNNVTMNGCMNLDTDPSVSGEPIILNDNCASIVTAYDDKVFNTVDSACVLVVRTWKVLDMCQFNANTGEGVFEGTQTIKLNNNVAPTILSSCQDTIVCSYGDCGDNISLGIQATDDCTDAALLHYSYTIDANGDGVAEYSGTSKSFTRNLADGVYTVRWIVEDLCGNSTECTYDFTVQDCKNPTPYCLGGVATALMNNVGTVDIDAASFDLGSFDNCTEQQNLQFSFSSNVNDDVMTFTCDMLENGVVQTFELELWVTDEAGNQDFCAIQVKVQDNFDVCGNAGSVTIGGAVFNSFDEKVKGTDVMLTSDYPEANGTQYAIDGQFEFSDMPQGVDYMVEAYKNDDMLNGISVLDIVLIQKHILGLKPFDTPHNYIAADVNDNGKVNGVDIVQIRKALLDYYTEFPDNTSWRFVDKAYDFSGANVYDYPESVVLNELSDDVTNADFTAIKIGDINQSADVDGFANTSINTRNMLAYSITVEKVEGKLAFVANQDINLAGLQLEVDLGNTAAVAVEAVTMNVTEGQVKISDNAFRVAYHNNKSEMIKNGDVLFNLVVADVDEALRSIQINENNLYPEAYNDNLEVYKIGIQGRNEIEVASFLLHQNTPNPFQKTTLISWEMPESESVELEIVDTNGKLVLKSTIQATKGENTLELDRNSLDAAGIYYYTIHTANGSMTKKMILVN